MAALKLPRKLRFTIVGHAGPRWRGAANDADADRRNERLANQRADTHTRLRPVGSPEANGFNLACSEGNERPDFTSRVARGDRRENPAPSFPVALAVRVGADVYLRGHLQL